MPNDSTSVPIIWELLTSHIIPFCYLLLFRENCDTPEQWVWEIKQNLHSQKRSPCSIICINLHLYKGAYVLSLLGASLARVRAQVRRMAVCISPGHFSRPYPLLLPRQNDQNSTRAHHHCRWVWARAFTATDPSPTEPLCRRLRKDMLQLIPSSIPSFSQGLMRSKRFFLRAGRWVPCTLLSIPSPPMSYSALCRGHSFLYISCNPLTCLWPKTAVILPGIQVSFAVICRLRADLWWSPPFGHPPHQLHPHQRPRHPGETLGIDVVMRWSF